MYDIDKREMEHAGGGPGTLQRAPAFRLACNGCRVRTAAGGLLDLNGAACQRALALDLALAVRFAENAARLLEASPRLTTTNDSYRRVFAHPPDRAVPWAPGQDSGQVTATRFRWAADALRVRVIHFVCRPQPPHGLPMANANAAVPRAVGAPPRVNKLEIVLFPRYWAQPRPLRAGTLVHETLHLIFLPHMIVGPPLIRDPTSTVAGQLIANTVRRVNAHCYEALVLLLNGHTPIGDLEQCHDSRP